MTWLWKGIQWVGWAIVTVIVLFLVNLAWFRWRGPTEAQEAALARVDAATPEPSGRNAFALMWLFEKDLPDDQLDEVARKDVRFANEHDQLGDATIELPSDGLPDLAAPTPDSSALCEIQQDACLGRIRGNPGATRAALAEHPRLRARAARIEEFDYFRNEFPTLPNMPVAYRASAQRLRLSDLALTFLDGRHEQALAGACRNLSAWRRFGNQNPSLIYTMIAVAQRDASMRLVAEMIAELEAEETVPDDCHAALQDVTASELSLCTTMIGEFHFVEASMRRMQQAEADGTTKHSASTTAELMLHSDSQYRAWRAEKATAHCGARVEAAAAEDRLIDRSQQTIGRLECASAPVGCILVQIDAPVYTSYEARMLDAAAHLRLAATLVWLREHGEHALPLAQRFDQRPVTLRSASRASGISDDGHHIWVENLYQQRGERFELPMKPQEQTVP